jgi:hypothetical protein
LVAFDSLRDQDCGKVLEYAGYSGEPHRTLYLAAGHACSAVIDAEPGAWEKAAAGLAALPTDRSKFSCYDAAAYRLLTELVAQHRNNPDQEITVNTPSSNSTSTSCPRIFDLIPDHGSLTGGYSVTVIGKNLPSSAVLHFGGHDIDVTSDDGQTYSVTAPPSGEPGEVEVFFIMEEAWGVSADFTYDAPADETVTPDDETTTPEN